MSAHMFPASRMNRVSVTRPSCVLVASAQKSLILIRGFFKKSLSLSFGWFIAPLQTGTFSHLALLLVTCLPRCKEINSQDQKRNPSLDGKVTYAASSPQLPTCHDLLSCGRGHGAWHRQLLAAGGSPTWKPETGRAGGSDWLWLG